MAKEYKKIVRREMMRKLTVTYGGDKNVYILEKYNWLEKSQEILKEAMDDFDYIDNDVNKPKAFKVSVVWSNEKIVTYKEIK